MKFLSLTHTVSRLLASFDKPTALRSSQLLLLLCQETTLFFNIYFVSTVKIFVCLPKYSNYFRKRVMNLKNARNVLITEG